MDGNPNWLGTRTIISDNNVRVASDSGDIQNTLAVGIRDASYAQAAEQRSPVGNRFDVSDHNRKLSLGYSVGTSIRNAMKWIIHEGTFRIATRDSVFSNHDSFWFAVFLCSPRRRC